LSNDSNRQSKPLSRAELLKAERYGALSKFFRFFATVSGMRDSAAVDRGWLQERTLGKAKAKTRRFCVVSDRAIPLRATKQLGKS
jgi:hypothetical protein